MAKAEHQLVLSKAEMKSCCVHQLQNLQLEMYRKSHTNHLIDIETIGEDLRTHTPFSIDNTLPLYS